MPKLSSYSSSFSSRAAPIFPITISRSAMSALREEPVRFTERVFANKRRTFTVFPFNLAQREAISPSDNSFACSNKSFNDIMLTSAIVHIILLPTKMADALVTVATIIGGKGLLDTQLSLLLCNHPPDSSTHHFASIL